MGRNLIQTPLRVLALEECHVSGLRPSSSGVGPPFASGCARRSSSRVARARARESVGSCGVHVSYSICAWWTWNIVSGVLALRSELAFLADFLADVAVYWFIWEPLLVLVISASMQFCACCKRCGRGKEPRAPEPVPSGRELTVVAQPLGTGTM